MIYEIRRVGPNTYDVFFGTQWDEWTRVRQGRSSTFVLQGKKLGHQELKQLHTILDPRMPINYSQPHSTTVFNCFNVC